MNGSYTDETDENKVTKKISDHDIFAPLITSATDGNMNKYFVDSKSKFMIPSLPNTDISNSIESITKIIGNLILLVKEFFEKNPKYESKKSYYEIFISTITILRTKLERGDIKKYQFYEELSFNLYSLSSLININTLSFMITHSIMIEYSRNREYNDKLLSQCVSNELITIASTQGVSIFDLEIAITFVVSIIFDSNTLSILYPKGFEGLYTLISIKKNIDGDLLNDTGFSLKQIGDFVDNVSFEAEEKSLSHEEITQLVETSITEKYEQIQAFKHEKQRIEPVKTRQLVSPVSGGNNNPKSKHNAKYRKKYKKFVSKYIIKKNKKQNKNKNKNKSTHSTKNKTKKNKRLTKPKDGSKSNSKYANKTLKNKKRKSKSKSKSSNRKSKHNKKAKTNYYNLYKHNKTLKH
jgi:DNA-binding transcriptional MerR regulator